MMLEILAEVAYIDSTSIKRSAYEKDLDVCIKKGEKIWQIIAQFVGRFLEVISRTGADMFARTVWNL